MSFYRPLLGLLSLFTALNVSYADPTPPPPTVAVWQAQSTAYEYSPQYGQPWVGCWELQNRAAELLDTFGAKEVGFRCDRIGVAGSLRLSMNFSSVVAVPQGTINSEPADWEAVQLFYQGECQLISDLIDSLIPYFQMQGVAASAFCDNSGGTVSFQAQVLKVATPAD